jgi:hypothetical protein
MDRATSGLNQIRYRYVKSGNLHKTKKSERNLFTVCMQGKSTSRFNIITERNLRICKQNSFLHKWGFGFRPIFGSAKKSPDPDPTLSPLASFLPLQNNLLNQQKKTFQSQIYRIPNKFNPFE